MKIENRDIKKRNIADVIKVERRIITGLSAEEVAEHILQEIEKDAKPKKRTAEEILNEALPNEFLIAELSKGGN